MFKVFLKGEGVTWSFVATSGTDIYDENVGVATRIYGLLDL